MGKSTSKKPCAPWCGSAKEYSSEAMADIRETMMALHKIGTIDDQTMRRFDCLTPVQPLSQK
jgi:hypothetical protein